jgi:hypothetical protein
MAEYTYAKDPCRLDVLAQEATAQGLPVDYCASSAGTVHVYTSRDLTAPEKTTLDSVVTAHDGRLRQKRPLWAIRADVQALTTAQFNNVWTDLTTPVPGEAPRKYLTDYGANVAGIFVFDWSLYVSGPTAAQQKAGQIALAAMYVQDNPNYLVHPPFDSTINVPGDEPSQ